MKKAALLSMMLVLMLFGCDHKASKAKMEKYTKEISETENAFMLMAREQGLQVAFTYFADDSAAINRGDAIIKGKSAIFAYYGKPNGLQHVKLEWSPDYIAVSNGGDMAYTYGKYHFSGMDSFGKMIENEGIFHTVWKRQPNGSWKYVYD